MGFDECDSLWHIPSSPLILKDNEVHVWRTTLDMPSANLQLLERILTSDERERANKFHFPKDRTRYIAAHSLLRTILAQYLAQDAQTIKFCYGEHGKPFLASESNGYKGTRLSFNMTHSQNIALYAISYNREVGIDVEHINELFNFEPIAKQFFSRYEIDTLFSIPAELRREAFFRCWTRKEAYVKARGVGLSLPLNQFDVSVMPSEKPAILYSREAGQDMLSWSFNDLTPTTDCVATLAVTSVPYRLICWQLPLLQI